MNSLRDSYKIYRKSKKSSAIIYVVLRTLVLLCMIVQIVRGEFENAFMCLLSLVLLFLPIFFQQKFKIELPNLLEGTIFFFIFSATILGEIYNFYGDVPHWDTLLHTINGFLCAGFGFALVDLLNKNSERINLTPFYTAFVAFCFSMTVGVCWEFFEYGVDTLMDKNTQKDALVATVVSPYLNPDGNKSVIVRDINKTILYDLEDNELGIVNGGYLDIGLHDTMKDLLVNFIGAVAFSTFGYFYIKNRDKYKFTNNFIPKRISSEN